MFLTNVRIRRDDEREELMFVEIVLDSFERKLKAKCVLKKPGDAEKKRNQRRVSSSPSL